MILHYISLIVPLVNIREEKNCWRIIQFQSTSEMISSSMQANIGDPRIVGSSWDLKDLVILHLIC
jgi:hypothetical protein